MGLVRAAEFYKERRNDFPKFREYINKIKELYPKEDLVIQRFDCLILGHDGKIKEARKLYEQLIPMDSTCVVPGMRTELAGILYYRYGQHVRPLELLEEALPYAMLEKDRAMINQLLQGNTSLMKSILDR